MTTSIKPIVKVHESVSYGGQKEGTVTRKCSRCGDTFESPTRYRCVKCTNATRHK